MKTVWISDEVLNWIPRISTWSSTDPKTVRRSYDFLARAEQFLNSDNPTAPDRSDYISNLRRCLTHRIRLFEQIYNLRSLVSAGARRPYLTILSELGIIRPFLLEGLLKVRNAVEYSDATPPSVNRCREFSDVTWYFLRSTDSISDRPKDIPNT